MRKKGDNQPKLTTKAVCEIRTKRDKGAKIKDLAKEYNVSATTICNTCTGRHHAGLPGPITRIW